MADPFVAEVRIFPFAFAPKGWAFCNGQLMPISQNTALFALVGTYYGGDGKSTFALPGMQANAPMFWGQGPGLSLRDLGETGGSETVTLIQSEMPAHTHQLRATLDDGDLSTPAPNRVLGKSGGGVIYTTNVAQGTALMGAQDLSLNGGSQPHNNMMPYLTLNFCIALQGVFPARG